MRDGLGRVESVLLLGGDSDIGVAIARRLVRQGVREVLLAGRNHERLLARAALLKGSGAERVDAVFFEADDVDSHEAFFEDAFARFGRFDVVVVAFGVLGDQEAAQRDAGAAVATFRTNALGAASALVHTGERLRSQGQGTLVLLSSVAGQRPRRSNFVYGSSKAGVDALAEGMAFVLRDEGVQVLTVRPGFVTTKMTEGLRTAPFATTPAKVAKATVEAIGAGKELIWVPGILRYVMWAIRLAPRPVFRRLKF